MKTLHLVLVSEEGYELETIPVDDYTIAEDPGEVECEDSLDNQVLIERVDGLYASVLDLLSEREAAPSQGRTWLKLALGRAILTAGEQDGDIVALEVTVQPLREGEGNAIPAP